MNMVRKMMAGILSGENKGPARKGSGSVMRVGMHQKNEHDYFASKAAAFSAEPDFEEAADALDIPETLERMIPEETEEHPAAAEISADDEVFEAVEDEETAEEPVEALYSVDYSGERIPVLDPVCGGVSCEPHELIYDRGNGKVCPIPDPLGVLTEEGMAPFFPEIREPSANVAAV